MGENGSRRHWCPAAAVSFAALVAACGGDRRDPAPVVMNGAGADRIEAAPIAPTGVRPTIAAPRMPPSPTGPAKRIVVRPGQSVGFLAREYRVTKRAIIEANNLIPPEYKIEIGKELIIPGGSAPHPPAPAGGAEKPAPPAPERAASGRRAGKAPEVIPLDEPAPASPRKSAEAPAISFPQAAAPARGRLSAPASEPAPTTARAGPPGEKNVAAAEVEEPPSRSGHLPWPVRGRILAGYGTTKGGAHNAGINIAAARGAPVRAVDEGVVAYAGNEIRGYGNLVLVKHPSGLISAYAHLDSLLVNRGDTVSRGQVIAKVGNTGGVGEPQLHFELRRGKKAVDPRELLGPGANAGSGAKGEAG
jgi:murein DD-endopeptidase MepM/ murein hydrolase activator NlpD